MGLPSWCSLSTSKASVLADGEAAPPFSDIILEVEDPSASSGLVRVAGHGIVIAACSGALDVQIRAACGVLRVDPLCCRSGKVLLAVLHFCYTGDICLSFGEDAFLLWQLLCLCVQYGLPSHLTEYARCALVRSLL